MAIFFIVLVLKVITAFIEMVIDFKRLIIDFFTGFF